MFRPPLNMNVLTGTGEFLRFFSAYNSVAQLNFFNQRNIFQLSASSELERIEVTVNPLANRNTIYSFDSLDNNNKKIELNVEVSEADEFAYTKASHPECVYVTDNNAGKQRKITITPKNAITWSQGFWFYEGLAYQRAAFEDSVRTFSAGDKIAYFFKDGKKLEFALNEVVLKLYNYKISIPLSSDSCVVINEGFSIPNTFTYYYAGYPVFTSTNEFNFIFSSSTNFLNFNNIIETSNLYVNLGNSQNSMFLASRILSKNNFLFFFHEDNYNCLLTNSEQTSPNELPKMFVNGAEVTPLIMPVSGDFFQNSPYPMDYEETRIANSFGFVSSTGAPVFFKKISHTPAIIGNSCANSRPVSSNSFKVITPSTFPFIYRY